MKTSTFYRRNSLQVSKKEGTSLGEMKLWVSYTADHVLPLETYRPLLDLLSKAAGDGPYKASAVAILDHLAHVGFYVHGLIFDSTKQQFGTNLQIKLL